MWDVHVKLGISCKCVSFSEKKRNFWKIFTDEAILYDRSKFRNSMLS